MTVSRSRCWKINNGALKAVCASILCKHTLSGGGSSLHLTSDRHLQNKNVHLPLEQEVQERVDLYMRSYLTLNTQALTLLTV